MLLLDVVRYQVLLCFRHINTDTIVINKLFKLNFRYFSMYLAICQQQGYQGIFKYKCEVFEDTYHLIACELRASLRMH